MKIIEHPHWTRNFSQVFDLGLSRTEFLENSLFLLMQQGMQFVSMTCCVRYGRGNRSVVKYFSQFIC